MSKRNKEPPRWRTPSGNWREHHIILFDSLINSNQWRKLSHGARDLYILLLSQYKGEYTGEAIKCPYTTIIRYGYGRQYIPKFINELEECGFIKVDHGGTSHVPNVYHFSDEWIDKEHASHEET